MHKRLIKASIWITILVSFSRLLGLVREGIIANIFGAGSNTDAFFVAFRIPDFLFNSLMTFLIGTSFVPVFSEYLIKRGEKEGWKLAWEFLNWTFVVLAAIAILLEIFAGNIVQIIAPGLESDSMTLATVLSRIMIPIIIFGGLTGLFKSMLNTCEVFVSPAFVPILFNLSIILCLFMLSGQYGIYSLAIGTLIAAFCQFLWLLLAIHRRAKFNFQVSFQTSGSVKILKLMTPVLLSLAVGQLVPCVELYLASQISTGAISYLSYAMRIFLIPEQMFVIIISSIFFPIIAKAVVNRNNKEINRQIIFANRTCNFVIIPLSLIMMALSSQIIGIILGRGAFGSVPIENTAGVFEIYCIALSANCLRSIITYTFFAMGKQKQLLILTIIIAPINIILDYVLVRYFGINGIAIGFTLTSFITIVILLSYLRYNQIIKNFAEIGQSLWKIIVSSALMYIFIVVLKHDEIMQSFQDGLAEKVASFLFLVLGGAIIYNICAWVLRVEEQKIMFKTVIDYIVVEKWQTRKK